MISRGVEAALEYNPGCGSIVLGRYNLCLYLCRRLLRIPFWPALPLAASRTPDVKFPGHVESLLNLFVPVRHLVLSVPMSHRVSCSSLFNTFRRFWAFCSTVLMTLLNRLCNFSPILLRHTCFRLCRLLSLFTFFKCYSTIAMLDPFFLSFLTPETTMISGSTVLSSK
jgi:hypothetical protein